MKGPPGVYSTLTILLEQVKPRRTTYTTRLCECAHTRKRGCDGVLINNLRLKQLQLYIVFSLLFSPNIPTLGKVTPSISTENVSTHSPNVLLCVQRVPSYPCTSLMTPACNSLWVSIQINEKPMFNAVACPWSVLYTLSE